MGLESLFGGGAVSKQSLADLRQPVPLEEGLKQQRQEFEDCTPCRLMGSAAFTGLGIYTYAEGMKQLRERNVEILRRGSWFTLAARRYSIFGLSATLVGMGVYRLYN